MSKPFLHYISLLYYFRKRSRKWDVPAENFERGSIGSSSTSDAAQKARERAAQLAAKLAAQGKLASSAPPPPIIVSNYANQFYFLYNLYMYFMESARSGNSCDWIAFS